MAILKQGILGGGSGSVASVVMTSWKGRNVLKAKPVSVANPQTEGQVAQRTSFKSVAQLGSTLLTGYVQKVLNVVSGNVTGYNKFCSMNKTAFSSVGAFVPANFKVGGGQLPAVASIDDAAVGVGDVLTFGFTNQAGLPATRDTDKAIFVAICGSTGDVWCSAGTDVRADETTDAILLTSGSDLTGVLQVHCYPAFVSADGRSVSVLSGGTAFNVNFGA